MFDVSTLDQLKETVILQRGVLLFSLTHSIPSNTTELTYRRSGRSSNGGENLHCSLRGTEVYDDDLSLIPQNAGLAGACGGKGGWGGN